jgi:hypothetical protein
VAQIVGPVRVNRSKVMASASDRALVDTAEVVPRQHRPRASGDTIAAARAGEDEDLRAASGGSCRRMASTSSGWPRPAADGLDQQRSERQLPDAGVAFGAAFEAATELTACLVAHLDDLEDGNRPIEVDPPAPQSGQLAEAQAGAEKAQQIG